MWLGLTSSTLFGNRMCIKADAPLFAAQSDSGVRPANMNRLLCTLLILAVHHHVGCTSESPTQTAEDVRIEEFSNVAVSTSMGVLYPEVSYGHLTVSLDLKMIADYRQAILCLACHWHQLLTTGDLPKATHDRFAFMDRFAEETSQEYVGRLDNIMVSLGINVTDLDYDHPHGPLTLATAPIRVKRQFISGAIGIAAGIGLTYGASSLASSFSSSNLADIADKKSSVLATTVEQEALTTATNHQDILRLNKTSSVILKQLGIIGMNWKSAQTDLLLLSSALSLMEANAKFDGLVRSLDNARQGEFSLNLASHDGLTKALELLAQRAAKHGKSLSVALPIDLTRLPCSLYHDKTKRQLHIISHVPLKGEHLTLYTLKTPPLRLDPTKRDLYARIDLDHTYLALKADKTLYQVYSNDDLHRCTQVHDQFFCPQTQLRKANYQSCALSLFNNHKIGVSTHCSFKLHKNYAEAERLNTTTFLVTELTPSQLTINCLGKIVKRDSIAGTKLVTLPPGCSGNTDNLVFRRESFEADVAISSSFGTMPLEPQELFPHAIDDTWMETARSWLADTGKAVDPHTISAITRMRTALNRLDREKSGYSWITLMVDLVESVVTFLVIIGLLWASRKLYQRIRPKPAPHHADGPSAPVDPPPPFNDAVRMNDLQHAEIQRLEAKNSQLREDLHRERYVNHRYKRSRHRDVPEDALPASPPESLHAVRGDVAAEPLLGTK